MILESVEHGPLIWPTVQENGVIRTKKYAELSAAEKIQADCDMKATNIILQGLLDDIYSLVNHHRVAKDLWDRVQLLMQGLNSLPPEWSKFVTDVKLVKDLHTSNFDQLHAYLEQHELELHANEVRIMRFAVPVFSPGDDLIACFNKAMAFLTVIVGYVQQVPGRQRAKLFGTIIRAIVKGNIQSGHVQELLDSKLQGEGHMDSNILSISDQGMLHDPGILADQAQTIIPHNAAFQTEDLDTYDSDCDDTSHLQTRVLMANISNFGSDIIYEVPNSETYLNDMDNQSVQALQDFEQTLESSADETNLYDGVVVSNTHVVYSPVIVDEETLICEKRVDKKCLKKAKGIMVKQAFWFHILNPSIEYSCTPPVIMEVPSELPKRQTPNALEEGEWGFEHTKTVFNNEIIPFLKSLKDIFDGLLDLSKEIQKYKSFYDQMDAMFKQSSVDKQCWKLLRKEILLEMISLIKIHVSRCFVNCDKFYVLE
ncbi:hypothetical protein Tco_0645285 [Tanacetum coccineum]